MESIKELPTFICSSTLSCSGTSSSSSISSLDDLSPEKPEWSYMLKGKLRRVITQKRAQSAGSCPEGESELDSPKEEKHINVEESFRLSRQDKVRKERNRLAAQRMRDRRKCYHESLLSELGGLQSDNVNLENEIQELELEKKRLERTLLTHKLTCQLTDRSFAVAVSNTSDKRAMRSWTAVDNVQYIMSNKILDRNLESPDIQSTKSAASCEVLISSSPVDGSDTTKVISSLDLIKSSDALPEGCSNNEAPIDLSTHVQEAPVDLRVPRGIKHKLYIQRTLLSNCDELSATSETPVDYARIYNKKLRLIPCARS